MTSAEVCAAGRRDRLTNDSVVPTVDLLDWLRGQCAEYEFDVVAPYRRHGDHPWPLTATDEDDLERRLDEGAHFLPLPKEPAALANVIEVSVVDYLIERTERL